MVHSLFSSTDDWDGQMESFESGWPGFIEVLRIYLANFAGMKAASFQVMHTVQSDHRTVWSKLLESLNLAGVNVGDRRELSQPEKLSGVVESIHQDKKIRVITLRIDAPLVGVAIVGSFGTGNDVNASMSMFLYGENAQANVATSQPKWQQWMREKLSV
jgi:hypothetical protein